MDIIRIELIIVTSGIRIDASVIWNKCIKEGIRLIHIPAINQRLAQTKVSEMNNSYWNRSEVKLPNSNIATVATSDINFAKGKCIIGVSAGDIVRVYVDNKMVINAWDTSQLINDADYHHEVTLSLKGRHTIRVEQAQYGDYGLLYVTVKPVETYDY